MVNIGLRVLYRPNQQELPAMYRKLGIDYDERVLPSICNEVLKAVVAQFNASQLITQRAKVVSRLLGAVADSCSCTGKHTSERSPDGEGQRLLYHSR